MTMRRLGPKHADRKRRKQPNRSGRRKRTRVSQKKAVVERLARQYMKRKQPTEMMVLLRLINILGLVLLVMSVAILSSNDNLKEIIELGRKLFILLP